LEIPNDDTNVSKHVAVIIIQILLIYNIYSALLVEIKTTYQMHGTYRKLRTRCTVRT